MYDQDILPISLLKDMESFFPYIRRKKLFNVLTISTSEANRFKGDYFGFLQFKGVDLFFAPVIMSFNNISNQTSLDIKCFDIKIPSLEELNRIYLLIK